jgi:hypothetical protein
MVGLVGRVISPSHVRCLHTEQHKHRINAHTDMHALSGISTHDPSVRASEDSSCLRSRGHRDRQSATTSKPKLNIVLNFMKQSHSEAVFTRLVKRFLPLYPIWGSLPCPQHLATWFVRWSCDTVSEQSSFTAVDSNVWVTRCRNFKILLKV